MTAGLAPIFVIAVVLASDVWVYLDARRCVAEGSPVELRIGQFVLATPQLWFLGCVVLWIFFFPMYLVSRSR